MENFFLQLEDILTRNQKDCAEFMEMISPKIEQASDEHERLYWHHIYEEEEQRYDRLTDLLPRLNYFLQHDENLTSKNLEFIHLLQDISLEKFGLHNFEEHLDLGIYWYKDTEDGDRLQKMRDIVSADYQEVKGILEELNHKFDGVAQKAGSTPTDDKDDIDENLKALKYTSTSEAPQANEDITSTVETSSRPKKRLTVGSLKK